MATPGELVRVLAGALGVPEATLVVHDRNLLAAGLRSKKGRGRGAPTITARDLAHLLTAVLGSAQVKDSVASVRRYSETRPYAGQTGEKIFAQSGIDELAALPREQSFVDALEALLIAASSGSLARKLSGPGRLQRQPLAATLLIEVAALTPGTSGDIRLAGLRRGVTTSVNYVQRHRGNRPSRRPPGRREEAWDERVRQHRAEIDLEQYRRISEKTILSAAEVLIANEEKS